MTIRRDPEPLPFIDANKLPPPPPPTKGGAPIDPTQVTNPAKTALPTAAAKNPPSTNSKSGIMAQTDSSATQKAIPGLRKTPPPPPPTKGGKLIVPAQKAPPMRPLTEDGAPIVAQQAPLSPPSSPPRKASPPTPQLDTLLAKGDALLKKAAQMMPTQLPPKKTGASKPAAYVPGTVPPPPPHRTPLNTPLPTKTAPATSSAPAQQAVAPKGAPQKPVAVDTTLYAARLKVEPKKSISPSSVLAEKIEKLENEAPEKTLALLKDSGPGTLLETFIKVDHDETAIDESQFRDVILDKFYALRPENQQLFLQQAKEDEATLPPYQLKLLEQSGLSSATLESGSKFHDLFQRNSAEGLDKVLDPWTESSPERMERDCQALPLSDLTELFIDAPFHESWELRAGTVAELLREKFNNLESDAKRTAFRAALPQLQRKAEKRTRERQTYDRQRDEIAQSSNNAELRIQQRMKLLEGIMSTKPLSDLI